MKCIDPTAAVSDIRGACDVVTEKVWDLIPFKLDIQKSVPACAKPIVLVIEPQLAGVEFQKKILPFSADHKLKLMHDDTFREISILLKF
jgi:hypothetical protein